MNNKSISLIINAGVAILAIIGIYFVIVAMGNTAVIDPETQQESADTSTVARAVSYALVTLYIAAGVILLFTVIGIAINPKRFIRTGISVLIFGGLLLLASFMINTESYPELVEVGTKTPYTDKDVFWGDFGIKATYVLVGTAIILIIVQSVRNLMGYFSK